MAVGSKEELQHESITALLPNAKIDKQIKVSERFNTIHEEFFYFILYIFSKNVWIRSVKSHLQYHNLHPADEDALAYHQLHIKSNFTALPLLHKPL